MLRRLRSRKSGVMYFCSLFQFELTMQMRKKGNLYQSLSREVEQYGSLLLTSNITHLIYQLQIDKVTMEPTWKDNNC